MVSQDRASTGLNGGRRARAMGESQPDKRLAAIGSEGRSRLAALDGVVHPFDPVRSGGDDALGGSMDRAWNDVSRG